MSKKIGRRKFIKSTVCGAFSLATLRILESASATVELDFVDGEHIFVTSEAMYYEKLPEGHVKCKLCPKECEVDHRERGWCGVRENRKGTYYTLVHSNPAAVHIDPIEKKPFFHFLPASLAFSISTAGCNFNCKYCQNWQISQSRPEHTENVYLPPEKVVEHAKQGGCKSIAYTYAEPSVFYEYMYDTSVLAKKEGVRPVVVTAGYLQREPVEKLCETVDAIKIDLKAFRDKFYREICSGTLQPVLDNLKTIKQKGTWLEIVDLVVPTLNDSVEEFRDLSSWLLDNLGPDVPLHFSRFYPMYQLKNLPPTPMEPLEKAREIAIESGLNYVYLGNVSPTHEGNNTYCPKCGKLLVERRGFFVVKNDITNANGKCKCDCGYEIPGVWT